MVISSLANKTIMPLNKNKRNHKIDTIIIHCMKKTMTDEEFNLSLRKNEYNKIGAMFFFGNGHWNKDVDSEILPCEHYNGKRNDDTTRMDDDKNKPLETN